MKEFFISEGFSTVNGVRRIGNDIGVESVDQAYDTHDKSEISIEVVIDPTAIFAMLFGSEIFDEYIGQLAMASMASMDIFTQGEQFDTKKLQDNMQYN
ncbi:hypothetical protein RYX36_030766 [Vicia faba]